MEKTKEIKRYFAERSENIREEMKIIALAYWEAQCGYDDDAFKKYSKEQEERLANLSSLQKEYKKIQSFLLD